MLHYFPSSSFWRFGCMEGASSVKGTEDCCFEAIKGCLLMAWRATVPLLCDSHRVHFSSTIHVSDMFFRLVFHFRMFHVNNLHGPKMAIENQVYFGTIWTSRSCAPPSLKWSLISFCWCKQMMEATHALLQPISCGSSASCGCCAWCEWSRWLCVGGGDFGEGWTCYETT